MRLRLDFHFLYVKTEFTQKDSELLFRERCLADAHPRTAAHAAPEFICITIFVLC
jgi:hypothetical protein